MNAPKTTRMQIGGQVWWEGAYWELCALGEGRATLKRGGSTASVSVNRLAQLTIDAAPPSDDDTDDVTDSALSLSMVPKTERARIERLTGVIVELGLLHG
ncbi:hypothetical protein ACNHYB_12805 [Isoptericola jiangsuensis]|uniref:hypothetical protein n=1 Tax=Isoptericola jiangsuensis TaxID=548579 RepID=UPI003AAACD4D